jgi:hypothetical protein
VLIVDDPALALERALKSGCELLLCNTRGNHPPSRECQAFENSVPEYAGLRHRHPNAGGFIRRTQYVKRMLRELMEA